MSLSVKGFKLSNGNIVRYDYSSLDNIITDSTLSVSGTAADAGAVGNELSEMRYDLDDVLNELEISGQTLKNKIDGAYADSDGYLFLTSDGEVVAGPIGPFAGGGSGGGGGGSTNNAVLTVTNTTGWLSKTISSGDSCPISFTWSSTEDDLPTGSGTLRITIGGTVRANIPINQGEVSVNLTPYLSNGSNYAKCQIVDVYGNSRVINYTVVVVSLSLSSTFDTSLPFTGAISFPYTPVGAVEKTVKFILDGTQIATNVTSASGRQLTQLIPAQSHGSHSLRVYFEAEINGETVKSNELYYEFTSSDSSSTAPIITSSFNTESVSQYSLVTIPYRVYTPYADVSEVTLSINGTTVSEQTVDRTEQSYSFRANNTGTLAFKIESGRTSKTITMTVTPVDIDVEAETENLVLHLDAQGRSNNEATRSEWKDGNISATLSGFEWAFDGWKTDSDGNSILRFEGDARAEINYKPFANDFKTSGKTIEIEFGTRQVADYSATIMSCMSGNIGFTVTPQSITFKGAQTEISTVYKDNEHIRLSITVGKQGENRLILVYINGIISRAIQYASGERFSQLSPVNITIGSNSSGIDIYNIRVYDNDLTPEQVENNWIADTQDGALMLDRYTRNHIRDEYGNITIETLPSDMQYMIIETAQLPQYKGDKKSASVTYVDPVYPARSFTADGVQINVQGTSSSVYYIKNIDLQFKNGFTLPSGSSSSTYALRPGSIPFNRFVLKADVASIESVNNTGLVMFYNDTCPYKVPEMIADERVRWGIEGIPIVMFWRDSNSGDTTFMGKYNFNLPKRAPEPYGYTGNDQSWEVERNNSENVKFQDDDFTAQSWDEIEQQYYPTWYDDWEARFPSDEWRDYSVLKEFISWVKSTDRTTCTNETLSSPVEYTVSTTATITPYSSDTSFTVTDEMEDGAATGNKIIRFTKDTPAYRLTKFRAEFPNYSEVESATFYYLFTEFFLMIDSRAKNMFMGFHGSTINDENRSMTRKVVFEPYDMDTAMGTNNSGVLMFDPYLEDTDTVSGIIAGVEGSNANVFNAQDSVLWVNFRDAYRGEIINMYRSLRSGDWNYNYIENRLEAHQAKWSEAIYNEDQFVKHIYPLINPVTKDDDTGELIRTDRYLTMTQGSKKEQRKWWLQGRFRYYDSKASTGNASSNRITMRLFSSGTLTLTSAIDLYLGVYFGGGTNVSLKRVKAGTPTSFPYTASAQEMETWIDSGDLITDVGDLSVFYPNEVDFSRATRLRRLQIGSGASGYSNTHLTTLDVHNSTLLEYLDVRNCPNLAITVNLEGSQRLEEAYFDGTAITGVDLADGCVIEHLHLPSTITTLALMNLHNLTDLQCPSYANVSRLMLTNIDQSIIDPITVLSGIQAGSQVNIQGFHYEMDGATEIEQFLSLLDTMQGVSREKNSSGEWIYHDYDTAQVSGEIHTSTLTGSQIASFNERYPYIRVSADNVMSVLTYKTWDGSSTIGTVNYINGTAQGSSPTIPPRTSTAQYDFTGVGWSLDMDDDTNDTSALVNVMADRTVYAAYSRTVRTYTITWRNTNGTVLETDVKVPYGTMPTYNGATPTYDGQSSTGWIPEVASVTGDQTYTAFYLPRYTATFKLASEDGGATLETKQVIEGQTPTYTGSTPVSSRQQNDGDFTFMGWDPVPAPIYANTTYIAVFKDNRSVVVQYLDGSLKEYNGNATKLSSNAFYNLPNLTSITASATTVETTIAPDCSNLTTIDLTSTNPVSIANNAFQNNNKVDALIVRSTTLSSLGGTGAIGKIKVGFGGIYVPSQLVSNYKTATNWSSFADNIYSIDDYPITDFSTISDDWTTIIANINNGTYSTKYSLGDTKKLNVNGNDVYMQLIAKDRDLLADNSGTAKTTWMVKAFYDTHRMNARGTTDGWLGSEMRSWLRETILPTIDSTVTSNIKEVTKTYYDVTTSSTLSTTDTVFIPSDREIFGGTSHEDSGVDYTDFFNTTNKKIKYNASSVSADFWWLRSANSAADFRSVGSGGSVTNRSVYDVYGVALCFCL